MLVTPDACFYAEDTAHLDAYGGKKVKPAKFDPCMCTGFSKVCTESVAVESPTDLHPPICRMTGE